MSLKIRNKHLKTLIWIIVALFLIYILALLILYLSVGWNKKFWEAKAKEPGEITYLALGDSAAQGIGATSPMRGYVGLVAKSLEQKTGKKVRIINLSKTGATLQDCLEEQIPKASGIKADLVTIEIGANDVKANNPAAFKENYKKLLPQLPDGTYVSNMPIFNSRPGSTQPARELSSIIDDLLSKESRLNFVNLQKETTDHQSIFGFAPDLFHPNNLSYKNWHRAFWREIDKKYKYTE